VQLDGSQGAIAEMDMRLRWMLDKRLRWMVDAARALRGCSRSEAGLQVRGDSALPIRLENRAWSDLEPASGSGDSAWLLASGKGGGLAITTACGAAEEDRSTFRRGRRRQGAD